MEKVFKGLFIGYGGVWGFILWGYVGIGNVRDCVIF